MSRILPITTQNSTCLIRPARQADADVMAALAVQLGYGCTGEEIRRRLGGMQDPTRYGVFVAQIRETQVVGWVGVSLFRAVQLETLAEITGLIVEESIRSRRIGEQLLIRAEEWARAMGCASVSVHSNINRGRAHSFYTNNGYELVKTQRLFRKFL